MLRERKAKVEGSYIKWGGGRPPLMLCRGIKRGMKSVLVSAANSEVLALSALSSPSLIQLHLLEWVVVLAIAANGTNISSGSTLLTSLLLPFKVKSRHTSFLQV